jgi:arabinogalactan oligomer/maltooligosaccharide transport system substrate-binding protein
MKRKLINSLSMALIALPLLAGCSGETEAIKLVVWEDQSNIEMLETIADEFIAFYKRTYPSAPSFTIEFQSQSEKSAVERLGTIANTGTEPDIVAFTHDTTATAAAAKLFAPISYSYEVSSNHNLEAVGAFSIGGVLYAYPNVTESITLMYDKRKVDAADLASFSALKTSGEKIGLTAQEVDSAYYMWGLCTDSVLFGPNFDQPTNVDIATSQSVANYTSFLNNYAGNVLSTSAEGALSLIQASGANSVAGFVSSPFMYPQLQAAIGEANAGLAILPSIDGIDQRPFSGFKGYGVVSYSKHPSLAQDFARYLTSEDAQYWRLVQKSYLPTLSSDRIEQFIAEDEALSVFKQSYENSMPMPTIAAMANFWSPMQTACTNLWKMAGSATISSVEEKLEEVTSRILNG